MWRVGRNCRRMLLATVRFMEERIANHCDRACVASLRLGHHWHA